MAPRKKAKLSNTNDATVQDNNSVKVPKKPRRSRKGCLEMVQELPLDVSLQIFGLLHPKDLLNLVKTSKAFRAFFLNRANSISIWKASLRGVEGLPEKPDFISEPALAQFLFSSVCQNCGKASTHHPIWDWFVRYCVECTVVRSCRIQDFDNPDQELRDVVLDRPFELFDIYIACGGRHLGCLIHYPQAEEFSQEWKKIANDDKDGRKALIKRQLKTRKENSEIRQRFRTWFMAEKRQRSAELALIKEQRLQAIMDRLQHEDSEWLPELEYFDDRLIRHFVSRVPLARQPTRLTDRAWPKVLASLQDQLAALREVRIGEEEEARAEALLALKAGVDSV